VTVGFGLSVQDFSPLGVLDGRGLAAAGAIVNSTTMDSLRKVFGLLNGLGQIHVTGCSGCGLRMVARGGPQVHLGRVQA
jgi:hypothetical protein